MKMWGLNSSTLGCCWWIEKALEPVQLTRCPFTQSSHSVTPSSCHSHKACWEAWFPGQPRGTFPWQRFRMWRWRTLACTSGVAMLVPIARPRAEQSSRDHFGREEEQNFIWNSEKIGLNKYDSRAYVWMEQQIKWEVTSPTSNCSLMNFVVSGFATS